MVREASHKKKKMCSRASPSFFLFFVALRPRPPQRGGRQAGWRGVVNGSQCADWAWLWVVGGGWLSPLARPPKQRTAPLLPAHRRTQPAHRATDPLKTSDLRRFVGCSRPSPTHHSTTPVLARPDPSPTLGLGCIGGWVYQRTNRTLARPHHHLTISQQNDTVNEPQRRCKCGVVFGAEGAILSDSIEPTHAHAP